MDGNAYKLVVTCLSQQQQTRRHKQVARVVFAVHYLVHFSSLPDATCCAVGGQCGPS
jgi:hypothetical protein